MIAMALILLAGANARAAADVAVEEYVRLHVIADNDGAAAQALKLEVRDAVLERARALLKDCDSADEAWAVVGGSLAAFEDAAVGRARAAGFDGMVRVEAGVCDFPERRYGGTVVPAGEYRALRVVIGAGEGHNWWCVLYPSLCLPEDLEPGEPVRFHSVLLDWLTRLLGGEG